MVLLIVEPSTLIVIVLVLTLCIVIVVVIALSDIDVIDIGVANWVPLKQLLLTVGWPNYWRWPQIVIEIGVQTLVLKYCDTLLIVECSLMKPYWTPDIDDWWWYGGGGIGRCYC